MRARWIALIFLIAWGPAIATAYLPTNIENTIRSWFNSAGKLVGFTAIGTITAATFNSPDADTAQPNRLRVYRNTVDRTCAANGAANRLSLLDTSGTGNTWCFCDGTTQIMCLPSPTPTATATPTPTVTSTP